MYIDLTLESAGLIVNSPKLLQFARYAGYYVLEYCTPTVAFSRWIGSGTCVYIYIYIYRDYVQILAGGKKETGIEVAGESATVR